MVSSLKYQQSELTRFATALLTQSGLDSDKAQVTAEILVQGDLMGHTTHGLALLAGYLREIEAGTMGKTGAPLTVSDFPAAVTWDGQRLPGPWLVLQAMALASARAATQGTCTVVIRRSHHIACLAAYLKRATDQGLMMLLHCSDANSASVAPFGGLDAVFTPNPMSIGFPTSSDAGEASRLPVLVDVSTSATTNGLTNRPHAEGKRLQAPWLIDGAGAPSDDPGVLFKEPKGTILPLGGVDSGHKGYGLSLMVEALTGGLAGQGRADAREGWGATVYLQIIDPRAFAGLDAFTRQTAAVADLCHASRPAKPGVPVKLPGQRACELASSQSTLGVDLYPAIMPTLQPWADKLGVALPALL